MLSLLPNQHLGLCVDLPSSPPHLVPATRKLPPILPHLKQPGFVPFLYHFPPPFQAAVRITVCLSWGVPLTWIPCPQCFFSLCHLRNSFINEPHQGTPSSKGHLVALLGLSKISSNTYLLHFNALMGRENKPIPVPLMASPQEIAIQQFS